MLEWNRDVSINGEKTVARNKMSPRQKNSATTLCGQTANDDIDTQEVLVHTESFRRSKFLADLGAGAGSRFSPQLTELGLMPLEDS